MTNGVIRHVTRRIVRCSIRFGTLGMVGRLSIREAIVATLRERVAAYAQQA